MVNACGILPIPISFTITPLARNFRATMAVNSCLLLVGLRHAPASIADLEQTFWAVADPSSPSYRAFRSREQNLMLPAPGSWDAARRWLVTAGADVSGVGATPSGDSIKARIACNTSTLAPPVPAPLRAHVDYAVLLRPRASISQAMPPGRLQHTAAQGSNFGPTRQKQAYGVPPALKGTNSNNTQMVWGPGTFGFRKADLQMFFSTYAPASSVDDVSLDIHNKWDGQTGENFPEGTLDASYAAAFAPGVKTIVANTNTSAATEDGEAFGPALLAFLVDLNGREKVPYVLSMSLGSLSFAACDQACNALAARGGHTYDACWAYLQSQHQACMFGSAEIESRIDAELMKLGLRGVTVTAASGDGGSHFAFGPFSGGIGGALDSIICSSMQMPVYPASSPYVLSIGGGASAGIELGGGASAGIGAWGVRQLESERGVACVSWNRTWVACVSWNRTWGPCVSWNRTWVACVSWNRIWVACVSWNRAGGPWVHHCHAAPPSVSLRLDP